MKKTGKIILGIAVVMLILYIEFLYPVMAPIGDLPRDVVVVGCAIIAIVIFFFVCIL